MTKQIHNHKPKRKFVKPEQVVNKLIQVAHDRTNLAIA